MDAIMPSDAFFFFGTIFLLTALVELITVVCRIALHLKSAPLQRRLHWPRVHHSYIGVVFVIASRWFAVGSVTERWTLIVGTVLILSDLAHHLLVLSLIRKHKWDIDMEHHTPFHHTCAGFLGIVLILLGILALLTPFTPGSWLIPIGLGIVLGRKRAVGLTHALVGRTLARRWGLDALLVHDIPQKRSLP